jgi:outer membrane protein OmpA-like peptidoglycan-associated protein
LCCRSGSGRQLSQRALQALVAASILGLSACNPIETYRNLTGVSKNDPDPATTPNTQNLTAGDKSPYPNLATVPPPPTQALTAAELDKLTQSLIADRKNAKYTSEQLQAGFDEGAGAPPPPLPPPPAAPPAPPVAGPQPAAPAAGTKTAPAPPGNGTPPPVGQVVASAPSAGQVASTSPAAGEKGARKSGQPPEPGPMESSLQSPQIASLPEPQQSQPAPPPPTQLRMSAASATGGKPAGAHLPAPPAPAPMPAAIASAEFQPPPPPPALAPAAPTRTAAATGPDKSAKQPPAPHVDTPVALINFAADSTTLSNADRQSLGKIVPLYRRDPGKVRVVGYAGVGTSADQQLNAFQAALDRAQAVAAALAKAGIPSDKILVEAAPVGEDSGQSRAEVLLEH